MDDQLNAKRIEWYRAETQPGNPWASVNDVQSDAIACEKHAYRPVTPANETSKVASTLGWESLMLSLERAQMLRSSGLA
jgi:hypothetical protein